MLKGVINSLPYNTSIGAFYMFRRESIPRNILIAIVFLFLAYIVIENERRLASLRSVQHPAEIYFDQNMPENATNINYVKQTGYGGFFDVSFTAPEVEIQKFVSGICGGEFILGYNPFNAVDTTYAQFIPDNTTYIFVETRSSSYYSYSLNTPITQAGNRCWDDIDGYYHILVNRNEPSNPSVRVYVGLLSDLQRYETQEASE